MLTPVQDAFVRELDPTSNFGAAGALSVAGVDSLNAQFDPRGRFDSLIQFDASPATNSFDNAYGAGQWTITAVELHLTENGTPQNPLFPRGVGQFEIHWLSEDGWTEGTGTPNLPTPGTGDELTWMYLQTLLSSGTESNLGTFSNAGVSGQHLFAIPLESALMDDLSSGSRLTLHLVPVTTTLGFTFHSKNFGIPESHPRLFITAVETTLGDANCDGALNIDDVGPFAIGLLDLAAYGAAYPDCNPANLDTNLDKAVDGADIQDFLSMLLAP